MNISEIIKQAREELGMTQEDLAERLEVSRQAVSKWERSVSYPDITLLRELAAALEVSVTELLAGERWIIDGNYRRTLEPRLAACDTVFFLDYPLEVCLAGVEARRGTVREDMPWIETQEDPEFTAWIRDFARRDLPEMEALLDRYRAGRKILRFQSREEGQKYLALLQESRDKQTLLK